MCYTMRAWYIRDTYIFFFNISFLKRFLSARLVSSLFHSLSLILNYSSNLARDNIERGPDQLVTCYLLLSAYAMQGEVREYNSLEKKKKIKTRYVYSKIAITYTGARALSFFYRVIYRVRVKTRDKHSSYHICI